MILRRQFSTLLNTILPARCLSCLKHVDSPGTLCSPCWQQLKFITRPYCPCCGTPFDYDVGAGNLCVFCLQTPPPFKSARSALVYDDGSKPLILSFKHADCLWGTKLFAQWLARAGSEILPSADLLVSVPLHWQRLLRRRYNQAALLTNALSDQTGIPRCHHILQRKRSTPSQGYRKRQERIKNVKGAFHVPERLAQNIRDKQIIIIDDVYTTGATTEECVHTLLKSGAGSVAVLTLARVKWLAV